MWPSVLQLKATTHFVNPFNQSIWFALMDKYAG
jgi:hypothetical protein